MLHGFVHHCYILYITEMPLGFMPLLEVDGRKLSQSMAVTRFIAKRCGELYIQCTMTRHIMQGFFCNQWVIRSHQSKKDRQCNGHKKTEDKHWTAWTPLKIGSELFYTGRVRSCCSTSGTCRITIVKQFTSITCIVLLKCICHVNH